MPSVPSNPTVPDSSGTRPTRPAACPTGAGPIRSRPGRTQQAARPLAWAASRARTVVIAVVGDDSVLTAREVYDRLLRAGHEAVLRVGESLARDTGRRTIVQALPNSSAITVADVIIGADLGPDEMALLASSGASALITPADLAVHLAPALDAVHRRATYLGAGIRLGRAPIATGRPSPAVTSAAGPSRHGRLTAREQQALGLVAGGLTHGQAARRMDISTATVDTHIKRTRAKLGIGNKAELTLAAVRLGLFDVVNADADVVVSGRGSGADSRTSA